MHYYSFNGETRLAVLIWKTRVGSAHPEQLKKKEQEDCGGIGHDPKGGQ
jgi:hypothetical protein